MLTLTTREMVKAIKEINQTYSPAEITAMSRKEFNLLMAKVSTSTSR